MMRHRPIRLGGGFQEKLNQRSVSLTVVMTSHRPTVIRTDTFFIGR